MGGRSARTVEGGSNGMPDPVLLYIALGAYIAGMVLLAVFDMME